MLERIVTLADKRGKGIKMCAFIVRTKTTFSSKSGKHFFVRNVPKRAGT